MSTGDSLRASSIAVAVDSVNDGDDIVNYLECDATRNTADATVHANDAPLTSEERGVVREFMDLLKGGRIVDTDAASAVLASTFS